MDIWKPSIINPFLCPSVIESLRQNAPTSELGVLRQVSTNYNKMMSSFYFDQLGKILCINSRKEFGMFLPVPDALWAPYEIKNMKRITHENWDSLVLAPIFRKVLVANFSYYKPEPNEHLSGLLDIFSVIQYFSPYVTNLKLFRCDIYPHCGYGHKQVSNIIYQLRNLKTIKFDDHHNGGYQETYIEIIKNLNNPSATIIYKLTSHQTWIDGFSNWVSKLKLLTKTFPNDILFDFKCEVDDEGDTPQELYTFAPFVLSHLNIMRKLEIAFDFISTPDNFEPIKSQIIILSPYLTSLHTYFGGDIENCRDHISPSAYFPKLKKIYLMNPNQNLEFLKNCPNLEKLEFKVKQDLEIFNNPDKSDKENIESCFEFLKKMKRFVMWYDEGEKIQGGNELGGFLRSILPSDVKFELVLEGNFATIP